MRTPHRAWLACLACLFASACATGLPPDALRLSPDAPANRELQTRRYEGVSEAQLLTAATAELQDLGFAVDESETALGIVVASKERSAVNSKEVAMSWALVVLSILAMTPTEPVYAKRQIVRASLVTRDVAGVHGDGAVVVRITFQRTVFDNLDHVCELGPVEDTDIYQEFFTRLDQSVFLGRHAP